MRFTTPPWYDYPWYSPIPASNFLPDPAAGIDKWMWLPGEPLTPPGTPPPPRVVLHRRSPAEVGVKVTEAEQRRRTALAERVRDTVPRLLVEFADRLEAVFNCGTVLQFDLEETAIDLGDTAERELQAGKSADDDPIGKNGTNGAGGDGELTAVMTCH